MNVRTTRPPTSVDKLSETSMNLGMRTGVACFLGTAVFALAGCGEPVTCGAGTRLNDDNQCVAVGNPDFNVVVDDFTLGDFSMTNVDVPEQMQPGFPDARTFTIKNTSKTDQEVVVVRVSVVPGIANVEDLQAIVENVGAEPECTTDAECDPGTACDTTEAAEGEPGVCKLRPILIGSKFIDSLAAGEQRDVAITYSLPPDFPADQQGVYGLLFSINEFAILRQEIACSNDAGCLNGTTCDAQLGVCVDGEGNVQSQYYEDIEHPVTRSDPFERAAALHAPATVLVGVPDRPNLRVLFAEADNPAFDLQDPGTPLMTVTGRMSAQGRDVVDNVKTTFTLHLPGHVPQTRGQDLGRDAFDSDEAFNAAPETTTWTYDANRTFNMLVSEGGADALAEIISEPDCVDVAGEEAVADDGAGAACSQRVTVQNDLGRDGTYGLFLSAFDQRILGMTADLASFNETLVQVPSRNADEDPDFELAGTVRMKVELLSDAGELKVDGSGGLCANDNADPNCTQLLSDNELSMDVRFFVPRAGRDATETDASLDNVDTDSDQPLFIPTRPEGDNHYSERDNLTPTWRWSVGNEWVGAEAQILNVTSKERRAGSIVAQKVYTDNYARLNALKSQFDIVSLYGNVDWSSRRQVTTNIARGRLVILGNTYLDQSLASTLNSACSTEGSFTACTVFANEYRPRVYDGTPAQNPRQKKRFYVNYQRSRSWWFAIGPLPFQIEVGVSAGLGMRATLAFVQDGNPESESRVTTGMQATLGPIADAGGTAFGGLSAWLLRAGIRGNINFVSVEFQPAVLVGVTQDWRDSGQCWDQNNVTLKFEGPLSLTVLSGDIRIVVEGGIRLCLPWVGCWERYSEIFGFTIVRIPPAYSNTWMLWSNTYNLTGTPSSGACSDANPEPPPPARYAPQSWNSPVGCWSGWFTPSYCNNNWSGSGNYSTTLGRDGACGSIIINGETERGYDFVTVTNASGQQLFRDSGSFSDRTVSACGPVTVRLTTDSSVVKRGVSVRAQ
jgi:hypothetical protein